MDIKQFISNYKNHPVVFAGTGLSLRYLKNSYTWDGLLRKICIDLTGQEEDYLDIKSNCQENGKYQYDKIASTVEKKFNATLVNDRKGKFSDINDLFYENMKNGNNISRFKLYISKLLESSDIIESKKSEVAELRKIRKNIGSIITTNYDKLIEQTFEFNPLIGNNILLSNPYGSVYKIHGCVANPIEIIITNDDYKKFNASYELIRAQLLSLFIHNPIIFLGYNIGDENIKSLLKTIFSYIKINSEEAIKIRNNFLLVEYEEKSTNEEITEHDIDIEGHATIRINKLKTDNFNSIYSALSDLHLPISAMDVRKVQSVVKDIYSGGKIKVYITENLDSLKNEDRIIAIGSPKTITYQYNTVAEILQKYFNIIDESNAPLLSLIDQLNITNNQYFTIFGFSQINKNIQKAEKLKKQQRENIGKCIKELPSNGIANYDSIEAIQSAGIAPSYTNNVILWNIWQGNISLDDAESFLRGYTNKTETPYRKMLCAYDIKKYDNSTS